MRPSRAQIAARQIDRAQREHRLYIRDKASALLRLLPPVEAGDATSAESRLKEALYAYIQELTERIERT